MVDPKFNVVIPYQYYNLVLVFVTILVLLWSMVAIKRVYRMLRIRSAVLSDRLIQIRGLGSYLTYFDGATRSHMDAVVHTRQSMPPVAMQQLNVASVVKDIEVSGDGYGNYFLAINMVSSCNSRVVALFDFNVRNFQQLMVQTRTDFNGNYLSDSRLFTTITGLKPAQHGMSSAVFPHFQRNEVCSFEFLSDDVGAGTRSVKMSLPSTLASFVQDKIAQPATADTASKLVIAVMVLPASSSSSSSSSSRTMGSGSGSGSKVHHSSSSPSSRKSSSRVGVAHDDGHGHEDGDNDRVDAHGGDLEAADGELLHLHEGDTDKDDAASVQSSSDSGTGRNPLVKGSSRKGAHRSNNNSNSSSSYHAAYSNVTEEPTEDGPLPGRSVQSMWAGLFVHSVNLSSLRSSSSTSSSASVNNSRISAATAPSELIVVDRQLNTFTSLEVFGLATAPSSSPQLVSGGSSSSTVTASAEVHHDRPAERVASTPLSSLAGTEATPKQQQQQQEAAVAAAAVCCGGTFIAEDCVVCLTDHKEVLLLPCRHLCVCEACLVFIDKCPVCRAAFEEYVTIKPSGSAVPSTAPVLPSLAGVGAARSSSSDPPTVTAAGGGVAQSYETMLNI